MIKAFRKDRKWWASTGVLESHLLHVLECLTLNFFAFYINHPQIFSTHTNSLVCHINYQCISSPDLLFKRELMFAFPVEMMEKQKRCRQIRSEKDNHLLEVVKCQVRRERAMSCQTSVNTDHSALVFWTGNGQSCSACPPNEQSYGSVTVERTDTYIKCDVGTELSHLVHKVLPALV